jgi:hypothetical protein
MYPLPTVTALYALPTTISSNQMINNKLQIGLERKLSLANLQVSNTPWSMRDVKDARLKHR